MEVQLLLGDELLVAVLAEKVQLAPVTLLTGDQLLLVSNKKKLKKILICKNYDANAKRMINYKALKK